MASQSTAGSALIAYPVNDPDRFRNPVTKMPGHQKEGRGDPASPRRTRKTVWDADIVIDIQHTKPGTTLDDHLRKEQTRAVLDLLADYKRKLDKNGDAQL